MKKSTSVRRNSLMGGYDPPPTVVVNFTGRKGGRKRLLDGVLGSSGTRVSKERSALNEWLEIDHNGPRARKSAGFVECMNSWGSTYAAKRETSRLSRKGLQKGGRVT